MKYKDHRELVLEEFKSNIDSKVIEKTTILDVGCNDGWFREKLINLGWKWIGLDIDPKIDLALKGKMENLPFCDNVIQGILCSHTFEHSQNPIQTLKEFHRVLKAGGFIFLITPFPCDRQIFQMDKTHWIVYSPNQMRRLLDLIGFQTVFINVNKNESEDPVDWHLITIANVI